MDLDSSLALFDANGQVITNIYYGNKSGAQGIMHNGDNLTGFGSGDDETIDIDLSKVSDQVHTIWPVITIYTNGRTFDSVSGAYCRLLDKNSRREFCRFNLSSIKDGVSNGNIMACLQRSGDMWTIATKGYLTQYTRTVMDVGPII